MHGCVLCRSELVLGNAWKLLSIRYGRKTRALSCDDNGLIDPMTLSTNDALFHTDHSNRRRARWRPNGHVNMSWPITGPRIGLTATINVGLPWDKGSSRSIFIGNSNNILRGTATNRMNTSRNTVVSYRCWTRRLCSDHAAWCRLCIQISYKFFTARCYTQSALCHSKSSVRLSVRPWRSGMFFHTGWNTS